MNRRLNLIRGGWNCSSQANLVGWGIGEYRVGELGRGS